MDDTRCDPVPTTDEDPLSRLLVHDIISNAAQELTTAAPPPPVLPVFRDLAGEQLEVDVSLFDNSKSLFYLKNNVLLPALRNRGVVLASGFWIEVLVATEEEEVGRGDLFVLIRAGINAGLQSSVVALVVVAQCYDYMFNIRTSPRNGSRNVQKKVRIELYS